MTNPLANQNRPSRPGAYRYVACASWVWLVPRATEVEEAETAGPVSLGLPLDRESLADELVLQPALGVLSPPTTPAMPYARPT